MIRGDLGRLIQGVAEVAIAALGDHRHGLITGLAATLGVQVVARQADELLAPGVELVAERLSKRFGVRLGLDTTALRKSHELLVRSIFEETKKAPLATVGR